MRTTAALLALAILALAGCSEGGTSPAGAGESSGVMGTVRLGPQCPVVQHGVRCPAKPAAHATVTVAEQIPGEAYTAGEVVAQTTTDAEGRYRVAVAPGAYTVTADAGMSCELMDVRVSDGEYTRMSVPCDTGIR